MTYAGENSMINGKVSEFLDKLCYEDHYVIYNSEKFFSMVVNLRQMPKERLLMFGWKYIISQQTKLYFQPQKFCD